MGSIGDVIDNGLSDLVDFFEQIVDWANGLEDIASEFALGVIPLNPLEIIEPLRYFIPLTPGTAANIVQTTIKNKKEIEWYWYANPYTLGIGGWQREREKHRRLKNRAERLDREALENDLAVFQQMTAELLALRASGELRLLRARISATYVAPGVFVTDDKPAEWRIYEELYQLKLLSSEEFMRQRAAASHRPFGMRQVEESFLRSARHFRGQY